MKHLLIIWIPMALFFFSCQKKSSKETKFLSLSKTAINGNAAAFNDTVQIEVSGQWAVNKPEGYDWVTIIPNSGSGNGRIVISVDKNATDKQRNVNLTVKANSEVRGITVVQAGGGSLKVSRLKISEPFTLFKDTFLIKAKGQWTITGVPGWLSVSPLQGSGNAQITLSSYENFTVEDRPAELLLKTSKEQLSITVTQEGRDKEIDFTVPDGWNLIFDDEFNTTGSFDTAKWNYAPRSSTTVAWVKFLTESPDYVHLDGSNLVLRMDNATIAGDDVPYHSGGVRTLGKFSFTYGKVEVRAKFNQGQGAWPAIWMMPEKANYGGWPNSGEIDIMEHVNKDNIVYNTAHNGAVTGSGGGSSASGSHAFNVNDYNIYGLEWTEDALKFYVNGQLSYTYNRPANWDHNNWPYDKPFYLILNQSGGAGWPGAITNSDLPFEMQVDWVRIYQR